MDKFAELLKLIRLKEELELFSENNHLTFQTNHIIFRITKPLQEVEMDFQAVKEKAQYYVSEICSVCRKSSAFYRGFIPFLNSSFADKYFGAPQITRPSYRTSMVDIIQSTRDPVDDATATVILSCRPSREVVFESARKITHMIPGLDNLLDNYARDVIAPLVESHINFAYSRAQRISSFSVSLEDRVEAALTGLVKAAHKFDFARGTKFSTYAAHWIDQEIKAAIADQVYFLHVPSTRKDEMLTRFLHDEITDEDKAAFQTAASVLYLSEPVLGSDDETIECYVAETVPSQEEFELLLHWKDLKKLFKKVLTDREFQVLILRFGLFGEEPQTLKEVSEKLGISDEYVRQIEMGAIKKLKASKEILSLLEELCNAANIHNTSHLSELI